MRTVIIMIACPFVLLGFLFNFAAFAWGTGGDIANDLYRRYFTE